jgi:hypothetical protein
LLLSEVDDQDFWDGVCEGCETVGLMASTIIDLYGFKHVST